MPSKYPTMKLLRSLFCIILLVSAARSVSAQDFAIKTNLIDDALLNVNIGIETAIAPQWTAEMPVSINAWTLSHLRRWKHWTVQPGVRRWFCDRFAGHFVVAHIHGGQYNIGGIDGRINFLGTDFRKLKDNRYQGWFIGAGISYGYTWILGRHWNAEAEIGFGWSYTIYDRYRCAKCGKKIEHGNAHHYVGPTKAAINIVYLF